MQRTLVDAVPMVTQAINDCISTPVTQRSQSELNSALKTLQAWMSVLPAKCVSSFGFYCYALSRDIAKSHPSCHSYSPS